MYYDPVKTVDVGDWVRAYDQSYEVVEIDDWGKAVCQNLNPFCLYSDDIRTFDDYDFSSITPKGDPRQFEAFYI